MLLREYVDSISDDDTLYSLGCQDGNAYVFIGTAKELKEQIDSIYDEAVEKRKAHIESLRRSIKTREGYVKTGTAKLSRGEHIAILDRTKKVLKKEEKLLAEMIPFKDREVVETYDRILGGKAIKITGTEKGDYWMVEEVKGRKKK